MDKKEFIVTRMDGSNETILAHSAHVGNGGELEFTRYHDYKEGVSFYGWSLYRIIAPGTWKDLVQVTHEPVS